jgi:uncharacterized protein (DUF1697 family)
MRNAAMVDVLRGAGLDDVRAVISSGNYTFRSEGGRGLEDRIEAVVADHLGAPCTAVVRSRRQIDGLTRLDVFDDEDDGPTARCNVTFLKHRPRAVRDLPIEGDGYRIIAVRRQAVFSVVDSSRSSTPAVMTELERTFGKEITTRTWRTVHRIARAFDD